MNNRTQIAVTGANGFVGFALIRKLIEDGYKPVAVIRKPSDKLKKLDVNIKLADISDKPDSLNHIFTDCSTVFHVASKVDMWGKYDDFYRTNVTGTNNVIKACIESSVTNLIYTSSPSVVADGSDLRNVDESYPVPQQHSANYAATKAIAEKMVLAANCPALKTLALRPHLIFGPGDRHFVPSIVDRARKGRLKIIGSGNNIVDFSFIEDCVQAHIDAMNALNSNKKCDGRAYFISQGDPMALWEFINKVLEINGQKKITKGIPKSLAMKLAAIFEFISHISPVTFKPLLTKFLVSEMTTDHYFNISAAKELLGYNPKYTMQQALQKMQQEAGASL